MHLAHIALWTHDLDAAAAFWSDHFEAEVGDLYESRNRPGFRSRFVRLPDGAAIELMAGPWVDAASPTERAGWDHIAISLGSETAVDALAARCDEEGCLLSGPRRTGDGFYEAVIAAPDGIRIEITS
ncbi:VOC family protein [Pleomorphomonas sp. PLEO]|uniref:VOC family protein n=1 Tax=Pleomorphomonas sp. PLEO TaxID=3239306 RepID=UPI00351EBDAB